MGIVRPSGRREGRSSFRKDIEAAGKEAFFSNVLLSRLPARFAPASPLSKAFVFIVIFWNMALAKWKCSKWDSAQFSSE